MGNKQSSVNPDPKGSVGVDITAPHDSCRAEVKASGYRTHPITDEEIKLFGITPTELKKACKSYFGKEPKDAFLRSPTLYGDMYAMYDHFHPVLTTVKPISAKIIDVNSKVITVATKRFSNGTDEAGTIDTTFTETESNTISSKWSKDLDCGLDVNYNIGLPVSSQFSLSNKFGTEFNNSKSITITSKSRVSTNLSPGKSIVVYLRSRKNTVSVKVIYEVSLEGDVACNYEGGYKGHTFWAFDVNDVLKAADKPTVRTTSEILKLDYFTDGEIKMSKINIDCSFFDNYCSRHGVSDNPLGNI